MTNLGFIGLGLMASRMVHLALELGEELRVSLRTAELANE